MSQLDPIVNQPYLALNGLIVSNDATTPNTLLDISAGICRDSNNIIDMVLGNYLGLSGIGTANASTTINAAVNGINGLDTGSLAASSVYSVFIIGDSSNKKPTGAILSLSSSAPLLPFGYDSIRLIGYWTTDSSSHFLLGYISSVLGGSRTFTFDAPQATAVTAGAATTYTAIDLSTIVPLVNQLPVQISYAFTPGAASRTLKMQGANSTGDAVTITGQVTSVIVTGINNVLAQTKSSKPEINYKVSNAGDAVAINVAGYSFSV